MAAFGSAPVQENDLMQFTAGGHVLGFRPDRVYVAGGDHLLSITFAGAQRVKAVADTPSENISQGQPLGRVTYPGLWPGIDLSYASVKDGVFESIWHIAPGAYPRQIRLQYNGEVTVTASGAR